MSMLYTDDIFPGTFTVTNVTIDAISDVIFKLRCAITSQISKPVIVVN